MIPEVVVLKSVLHPQACAYTKLLWHENMKINRTKVNSKSQNQINSNPAYLNCPTPNDTSPLDVHFVLDGIH